MSQKDFSAFEEDSANQSSPEETLLPPVDPNMYLSSAVHSEIREKQSFIKNSSFVNVTAMTPLVAPLQTIFVSLQLSVLPHKNKYGQESATSKSKALLQQPKDITLQDRRRYELLVRSGVTGSNKPFQAPIYESYASVVEGLKGQGWQGFYKGALSGLIHTSLSQYFKFRMLDSFNQERFNVYSHSKKEFMMMAQAFQLMLVDVFIYPLQVVQSRFILQNRNPNFTLYQKIESFFSNFKVNPTRMWAGASFVVPHALVLNKTFDKTSWCLSGVSSGVAFSVANLSATWATYPLMTAMRRMQCQSDSPGMLPPRYSSSFHALRLILQEEGLKGLYRGFGAAALHQALVSTFIFRSIIQTNNQFNQQY